MTESEQKAYNNGLLSAIATKGVMKISVPVIAVDYKSALKFFCFHDEIINRDEYIYHAVIKGIYGARVTHVYGNTPSEIYTFVKNTYIVYQMRTSGTHYFDTYDKNNIIYQQTYEASDETSWINSEIGIGNINNTTDGLLTAYDRAKHFVYFTNHDLIHSNSLTYNGVTHTAGDLFKSASI